MWTLNFVEVVVTVVVLVEVVITGGGVIVSVTLVLALDVLVAIT